MERKGTITLRAGATFRVKDETIRFTRPLDLEFVCLTGPQAKVYLSGNPLEPTSAKEFELDGGEEQSIQNAAKQVARSLARRYYELSSQDPRRWRGNESQQIETLRGYMRFI